MHVFVACMWNVLVVLFPCVERVGISRSLERFLMRDCKCNPDQSICNPTALPRPDQSALL